MNTKEITILITWKGFVYELEESIEDYLTMKSYQKSIWEDGFKSNKYREYIKFANLSSEKWRTLYIALPEPKKKLEMTDKEREETQEFIKNVMKRTEEWRKKRFLEQRQEILQNLANREKSFWMDTTLSKINKK